jgi:predicted tellurium resistance membrane protein TerC
LILAMLMRIGLLLAISWIMGMKAELFRLLGHSFTGRDLILIGGGLFLVAKATYEIHEKLEVSQEVGDDGEPRRSYASFGWTIFQIMILDIVFSLDSVITAVGMAQHLSIMIAAVVISIGIMLIFAGKIGDFVEKHPSIKVLALSFLLLIGVLLIADGMGKHIEKGYVYFAMAFSLAVELVNMRMRRKHQKPVQLHEKYQGERKQPGPGSEGP